MERPVDLSVDGPLRFRIDLSYDGTNFYGWAKQLGLRTVQSELVEALNTIFGDSEDDFGMRVAGRTDAGVHAEGQVVHIDLSKEQFRRLGRNTDVEGRLNKLLTKGDIWIKSFEQAPAGFDARFSAINRRYIYKIADKGSPKSPQIVRYALYHLRRLDEKKMHEASQALLGLHDFASYCKPRSFGSTIRRLEKVNVTRKNGIIEIELQADAFAHNMVRSIVGALIKVGDGKATKEDIARVLAMKKRTSTGWKVVEPHGLTLMQIGYPAKSKLAAQAIATQRIRTEDDI